MYRKSPNLSLLFLPNPYFVLTRIPFGINNNQQIDVESRGTWRQECSPLSITLPHETTVNGVCSGNSTPSTISPGENASLEDELGKVLFFFFFLFSKPIILKDNLII